MATEGSEENPNTCAVCLNSYQNPKFLSCYHTFCAACIQDIADRHSGGDFPCPSCRRVTSLPPGGVASLQTNFYIRPPTVKRKSSAQDMCSVHSEEKLRFCCLTCDAAICRDCKLTKHEGHKTDDLSSAASPKRKKLQTDEQRLQQALTAVTETVTSLQEERKSLDEKRAAVEKDIRNRYDIVVAAAKSKMDEELASLQSVYTDMDSDIVRAIEEKEGHRTELSKLSQQLNNSISTGSDGDIITLAKEMKDGRGSQKSIDAMTSREDKPLHRPILNFSVSTDVMTQTVGQYLGSVRKMEVKETRDEVRVTERFQCAQGPDVEVFSLCHVEGGPPVIYVSYERCGMKKDAPCKSFTETGFYVDTCTGEEVGKVSYRGNVEGELMYFAQQSDLFRTYCKSPTASDFLLVNDLSGQADIKIDTVTSRNLYKTEIKTLFPVEVGPHRAFDVDDTEQYFAVVEEARQSTHWRSVSLYRRSVRKAVSTYTPPTAQYQPSDVCFYTLGGQKVLLITDELNDAIHVVTIQGETMRFERYLCAGCPSLIQPTAITVDVYGRLWVACRGGAVLTIERTTFDESACS